MPKIKQKYVEKPSWKKLEENFGNLKEMDRGHEGDFAFTMAEVLFDKMIHCGYNVRLMDDWVYMILIMSAIYFLCYQRKIIKLFRMMISIRLLLRYKSIIKNIFQKGNYIFKN